MKKLLIVLFTAGMITTVSAQPAHKDVKNYGYSKYENKNDRKEPDQEIRRINRDFDKKIQAVKNDRRINQSQKYRFTSLLEKQRKEQNEQVLARYSNDRNRHYDDGYAANTRRF